MKYVIYTGSVISQTDGQRHLLTAGQIAHCYGVLLKDCYVIPYTLEGRERDRANARVKELNLLPLTARYKGDYKEHLAILHESQEDSVTKTRGEL